MNNTLDLRKKEKREVKIIEKIVIKKRSFKSEIIIILVVTIIATLISWAYSKAEESKIIKQEKAHVPVREINRK